MSQAGYTPIDLAAARSREVAELAADLAARKTAMFSARFAHNAGRREKTHLLGQMRRDIARVATLLGQKTKAKQAAAGHAEQLGATESSSA